MKVIEIENLSKKYQLYHESHSNSTLVDLMSSKVKRLCKSFKNPLKLNLNNDPDYEDFYALKDVSLDIHEGDRVGIIGRNGAGKSTLLKILSRITEPSSGRVKIKGRLSSLLEVGTGFHQELTGRENIYLNGAILGMKSSEIRKKFDEIVAFSEVEKFLDTPVKRYSSGMYMRLGFAIAAHLESSILIVDEVLAVGDLQFQAKCFAKLNDLGAKGRTVIFVSHHIGSVVSLCNKGLYLEKGKVIKFGNIEDAVDDYMKSYQKCALSWQGETGDEHIRVTHVTIENPSKDFFYNEEEPTLQIDYEILKPDPDLFLGIGVWNMRHQILAHSKSCDDEKIHAKLSEKGKGRLSLKIDTSLFHEGEYLIKLHLAIHNKKQISDDEIVLKFPIITKSKNTRLNSAFHQEGISLSKAWECR